VTVHDPIATEGKIQKERERKIQKRTQQKIKSVTNSVTAAPAVMTSTAVRKAVTLVAVESAVGALIRRSVTTEGIHVTVTFVTDFCICCQLLNGSICRCNAVLCNVCSC
jgi:hypothetical protein